MTPKEKAEELVDKFKYLKDVDKDFYLYANTGIAKKYAVIAVDEILNAIEVMVDEGTSYSANEYYLKVKQEIEKL